MTFANTGQAQDAPGPVAERDRWAARGWPVPHRSTVNTVLKRAGLVKPEPRKRPRSWFRRFAYTRPRDCYQVDATEVKLPAGRPPCGVRGPR